MEGDFYLLVPTEVPLDVEFPERPNFILQYSVRRCINTLKVTPRLGLSEIFFQDIEYLVYLDPIQTISSDQTGIYSLALPVCQV